MKLKVTSLHPRAGRNASWTATAWSLALGALPVLAVAMPVRADVGYLDQGSLVAWGDNSMFVRDGLGDYTIPSATANTFTSISAGLDHNLALRSNATAVGWGLDFPPTYTACRVPPENDFVQVASGAYFSVALRSDGSLAAWGLNDKGQCGVPLQGTFTQISAGITHSAALREDGVVVAWGENTNGECDIPAGNDFAQIACGVDHSLALRQDGTMVVWPAGAAVALPGDQFAQVACGGSHHVALKKDGSLVAWGGQNQFGQLDVPAGNDFVKVDCGADYSLALRKDGTIVAWGDHQHDQLAVPASGCYLDIAAGDVYQGVAILARETYQDLVVEGMGNRSLLQRSVIVAGDASIRTAMTARNAPAMIVLGSTRLDGGVSLRLDNTWLLTTPSISVGPGSVLTVSDAGALTPGTGLTIDSGGVMVLDGSMSAAGDLSRGRAVSGSLPVPEPRTALLLTTGVLAGLGLRLRCTGPRRRK